MEFKGIVCLETCMGLWFIVSGEIGVWFSVYCVWVDRCEVSVYCEWGGWCGFQSIACGVIYLDF